jgi:hypothetical protein
MGDTPEREIQKGFKEGNGFLLPVPRFREDKLRRNDKLIRPFILYGFSKA